LIHEVADHVVHLIGGPIDVAKHPAQRLRRSRRLVCEHDPDGSLDRGERRSKVVGDACDEVRIDRRVLRIRRQAV
jgi:hypothetical protein